MENLTLQQEIVELKKETLMYKKIAKHLCFWVSFVSILILLALVLLVAKFPAVMQYKTIIYITFGIFFLVAMFTSSMFEVLYQETIEQNDEVHEAEYNLNKVKEELARI